MKVALFLGAGASTPYGMPTTRELLEKIRADRRDFPLKDLLGSPNFPDIEHVLDALNDVARFAKSPGGRLYAGQPPGEFASFAAAAERSQKIIEDRIYSSYKWDPEHDHKASHVLGRLFDMARGDDGRATVFTTNFDTVIEEHCRGVPEYVPERNRCIDGFAHDKAKNMIVWKNDFSAGGKGPCVILYKLHGSLSWSQRMGPDIYVPGVPVLEDIVQKPDTSPSDDVARDVYIRPLLEVKDDAAQKAPYAEILQAFEEALPAFDACVAVGYSFRDRHLRDAFMRFAEKDGMLIALSPTAAADICRNIVGWDPKPGDLEEWEKHPLCHFSYRWQRGEGGVYAVHQKIGYDEVDDALQVVKSVLAGKASPQRFGPFEVNPTGMPGSPDR